MWSLRRRRDERGASALEFAFLAPALVFLIFFSIQAALFFYGRSVAMQAAREGVSQMRLMETQEQYDQHIAAITQHTVEFGANVGRESLLDAKAVPTYDAGRGRVSMVVSGRVISLLPGIDLKVSQVAEGPIERFEADQ